MTAWTDAVLDASPGPDLRAYLVRRLVDPYKEGPALDDRRGESPEEVFEDLSRGDAAFRLRLEETIAEAFKGDATNPAQAKTRPVIRGLLEIVGQLALTGAFTPLRAWLSRHQAALEREPSAALGRAALGALATSQPVGIRDLADFWLAIWRTGPPAWQPRAFIGLRLQAPKAAAAELGLLVERAEQEHQDPGPMLQGMWQQGGTACLALLAWLHDPQNTQAGRARQALMRRLPPDEAARIGQAPKRVKRALPSLAAPNWAAA